MAIERLNSAAYWWLYTVLTALLVYSSAIHKVKSPSKEVYYQIWLGVYISFDSSRYKVIFTYRVFVVRHKSRTIIYSHAAVIKNNTLVTSY